MSHKTEHVGHWEDLETWLSVVTVSLLPKAAETLKHQTQDQLDDNIASLMRQDPSQSYSHKELAKITGSLSHTLVATLKLSDKHAAQRQQELTHTQRRIEQLELEAQERQSGTDEVEQGAEEEINRLKETLPQGFQTQLTRGPLEVESGSGWAAISIPQKKGFTYSKKRSTTYPIFSIFIINSSSTWMYINSWTPPEAVTRLSMVAHKW